MSTGKKILFSTVVFLIVFSFAEVAAYVAGRTLIESGIFYGVDDLSGAVEEAMQPTLDTANVLVSCQIDGRTEFTRKFDCHSRGGRLLNR